MVYTVRDVNVQLLFQDSFLLVSYIRRLDYSDLLVTYLEIKKVYSVYLTSKLGYLAPQDNFSVFTGTPKCETNLSPPPQKKQKNNGMGYVNMHGFHGNPLYYSREWL